MTCPRRWSFTTNTRIMIVTWQVVSGGKALGRYQPAYVCAAPSHSRF